MKTWIWAVVAALGAGLMVASYERGMRLDRAAPWRAGLMIVGDGEPAAEPPDGSKVVATRLRYLPAGEEIRALVEAIGGDDRPLADRLSARLRTKVIAMPGQELGVLATWLCEGRMPKPGGEELLAGWGGRLDREVPLGGKSAKVVGVLKPDVALLAESFLVPEDATLADSFAKGDPATAAVRLIPIREDEPEPRNRVEALSRAFLAKSFAVLPAQVRPAMVDYLAYLGGQALFLLGGSGLLIALYRWLAGRIRGPLLGAPLRELASRPRLLWGVHIAFFGLYLAAAAIVAFFPMAQTVASMTVQGQFGDDKAGALAVAGRAYATGNIAWAAAVTFAVNFFLGSLAMITAPSMIIPGVGALLAVLRAGMWGVILSPGDVALARMMIPHTGTLLLEGEGYILATFFAILVPILLLGRLETKPSSRPVDAADLDGDPLPDRPAGVGRRYLWALALNIAGNILVAIVLAVAAVYEAAEVITMAGF